MQTKQVIEDSLQRKTLRHARQKQRMEQLQLSMQNTESEIEQLQQCLEIIEHMSEANRKPKVIPNNKIAAVIKALCGVFDFLQHRLHTQFKYQLACLLIDARYKFKSRLQTPGREYLSFETIMTYFKRERGMTG